MKTVHLHRFGSIPGMGTFGELVMEEFHCKTVERPWAGNAQRVSCIPSGIYPLVLGRYNRGGYAAYEVMEVPGRHLIKIHKGNTMDDLLGCIAPGKAFGYVHEKWAVIASAVAFGEFMRAMGGVRHAELIIDSPGGMEG